MNIEHRTSNIECRMRKKMTKQAYHLEERLHPDDKIKIDNILWRPIFHDSNTPLFHGYGKISGLYRLINIKKFKESPKS